MVYYYFTILIISLPFAEDSTNFFNFDLKKGLNMKGLLDALPREPDGLSEDKINMIINQAKSYPIEDVEKDEFVILETSIGKMIIELYSW